MKVTALTFEDLNLSPEVLNGLRDVNLEEPTQLQHSIITNFQQKKDILARANPGSEKNTSLIIPALEKLVAQEERKGTHVLILTPHADTAKIMDEAVWAMGYHAQVECASIDMDGDMDQQEEAVAKGVNVLVANPGRLIEVLQKNLVVLRHLDLMVVDAVDEMIGTGLTPKIEEIQKRILSEYQTLMFASSLDAEVKELVDKTMEEPVLIGFEQTLEEAAGPPPVPAHLKQGYIKVPNRMKISTLMAHIDSTSTDNCVIFTASKKGTERLYRVFKKRGLKATSLHPELNEKTRDQRFSNFTSGNVQYLLVSEISAADLDLSGIRQVINYDVPNDPDEYRYRAGLVGSGKAGRIVSLVSKQDRSDINQLQNELGQAPQELPLPDAVQQKLKKRRSKSSGKSRDKRPSRGGRSPGKKKKEKKEDTLELPRPSYDKLSGGRSGEEEPSGVVGFFKKLFS